MEIKVYIETYGCSANKSESELIAGILEKEGMKIVDSADSADVVIINTCIVKRPTETKIFYRIKQLSQTGKRLIVAGCMPEVRQREILAVAPAASIVSTHQIRKIKEAVISMIAGEKKYFIGKGNEENIGMPRKRFSKVTAIIEILKGCLGECAYCSVRGAKGKLKSYSKDSIIQEVMNAVSDGCKEIWLTAQDCGCYGKEKNDCLVNLLGDIEKISGDFRIRIGMMNPEHVISILSDLIECYKNERVYKFLHIPVQSGSDSLLKRMKRKYNTEDFRKIIIEFRKEIPDINIWTDIIVGFPGETEEEFNETIRFLEEARPDFVNISKFSAMKGTPAAGMKQVDNKLIAKRTKLISDLCIRISFENNSAQIGKKKKILLNEEGKNGTLKGRDESFRQVVLKISEISDMEDAKKAKKDAKLGKIVEKEIKSASPSGLHAF
jgi:MiaB-like tRNA modifying enzyme